jgi:hypothetical protein
MDKNNLDLLLTKLKNKVEKYNYDKKIYRNISINKLQLDKFLGNFEANYLLAIKENNINYYRYTSDVYYIIFNNRKLILYYKYENMNIFIDDVELY